MKQALNKLIDGFASAVAGQDLDAVLEYVAADITIVTYFGEDVLNEIFASIIEAEVIPTLEDPEDEMWGYQDILPEFLEMMEELKDLYDAKGAEDPEVQELMYDVVRYWSKLGLISDVACVYLTEREDAEVPTAFWVTLLGWVDAAEWTNDSLIVPADVFEHFVAGILEDLSVAADELGPFSEAGKWYAEISLRSNAPEDEEEYGSSLIGFKDRLWVDNRSVPAELGSWGIGAERAVFVLSREACGLPCRSRHIPKCGSVFLLLVKV